MSLKTSAGADGGRQIEWQNICVVEKQSPSWATDFRHRDPLCLAFEQALIGRENHEGAFFYTGSFQVSFNVKDNGADEGGGERGGHSISNIKKRIRRGVR